MVGAAQQGRSSVGIDVNPLAAFIAKVKLTPLTHDEIRQIGYFLKTFHNTMNSTGSWPVPALRISTKVFEPGILDAILRIRTLIETYSASAALRNFLLLAWLSILQDVGSYFKEGNGIKYRNRKRLKNGYTARPEGQWQHDRFGPDQRAFVSATFKAKLAEMLSDAPAWQLGNWAGQRVTEGNSLEEAKLLSANCFDSIVFSPPYANRFDYFESQKVELWFGGFVETYDDMITLRKRSVRSHLGAALDNKTAPAPGIEQLIDLINPDSYAIRMRVPALIRGYFSDMAQILQCCQRLLRAGGKCFVVVGNSAYGGVIIPTDSLIARLGLGAGFGRAAVIPVRHLTVAPQQRSELLGKEEFMRESVVVLS